MQAQLIAQHIRSAQELAGLLDRLPSPHWQDVALLESKRIACCGRITRAVLTRNQRDLRARLRPISPVMRWSGQAALATLVLILCLIILCTAITRPCPANAALFTAMLLSAIYRHMVVDTAAVLTWHVILPALLLPRPLRHNIDSASRLPFRTSIYLAAETPALIVAVRRQGLRSSRTILEVSDERGAHRRCMQAPCHCSFGTQHGSITHAGPVPTLIDLLDPSQAVGALSPSSASEDCIEHASQRQQPLPVATPPLPRGHLLLLLPSQAADALLEVLVIVAGVMLACIVVAREAEAGPLTLFEVCMVALSIGLGCLLAGYAYAKYLPRRVDVMPSVA